MMPVAIESTADVRIAGTSTFSMTYDYNMAGTKTRLGQFAKSLCDNFAQLQSAGHPKWKEVSLTMPQLGQGWSYFAPTAQELSRCVQKQAKAKSCTTEQKILGLCEQP